MNDLRREVDVDVIPLYNSGNNILGEELESVSLNLWEWKENLELL